MALDTMYAGKVNSPATTLDGGINDSVTTINVVDGGDLPDAPNIAVIGTGEDAETILYGAKNANELSSVTRGFEGTAKAWDDGTPIARLFTAYDYDTLRENITDLESRLGEANTASNIGSQVEIFKQKEGVDLEFRTLKANSNKIELLTAPDNASSKDSFSGSAKASTIINNANYYKGQSFTTTSAYTITSIKVYIQKDGSPGNLHIDVYLAAESHLPTGDVLATGEKLASDVSTGLSLQEIELDAPLAVADATKYVFMLRAESADMSNSYILKIDTGNGYAGGVHVRSSNGGSSFNIENSNYDLNEFEIWGVPDLYDYIAFDVAEENIKLDDLASPDDNTDLNASTSAHGLLPKLPNSATQFLNGVGTWATISSADLSDINITSATEGDILYYNGSNWVNLGIGSEGQVLKVSSEGIPEWATP